MTYYLIIVKSVQTKEELEKLLKDSPAIPGELVLIPGELVSIQTIRWVPGVMSTGVGI